MRILLVGFWLLIIITAVAAQDGKKKPDGQTRPDLNLTGTWSLDEAHSSPLPGKEKITDYTLTIVHHESEIRVTKKYKQGGRELVEEFVIYTDGRRQLPPNINDPQPVTKWNGKKLVTRIVTGTHSPFRNFEVVTDDEWELSKDGKILTRTVSSSSTSNRIEPTKERYVFTRVS